MTEPTYSTFDLVLEKVAAQHHISAELVRDPYFPEGYILRMVRKVATWQPPTDDVVVPATWWDHWKHAHRHSLLFGAFVRAHPPRMATYRARYMLPDFPIEEFRGAPITRLAYFQQTGWGA